MKKKQIKQLNKKILQAIYNSKRYNTAGRKEVVEKLLQKKILKIVLNYIK